MLAITITMISMVIRSSKIPMWIRTIVIANGLTYLYLQYRWVVYGFQDSAGLELAWSVNETIYILLVAIFAKLYTR